MSDAELHRAAVGLLALTYNETHGGSGFRSPEAQESLLELFRGLQNPVFTVECEPEEDLTAIVEKVAQATADMLMVQVLRALNIIGLTFVQFCTLIEHDAPSVDIDFMIKCLALAAANDAD
jgi:hypothetical protein